MGTVTAKTVHIGSKYHDETTKSLELISVGYSLLVLLMADPKPSDWE